MSLLAKGVPVKTAEFIYNHQTQTTYDVAVGGLISERTYGGQDSSFGNGQGGDISAESYVASQDITNRVLEQCPVKACTIRNPVSGEIKSSNGALFANDLSISARFNITNHSPISTDCSTSPDYLTTAIGHLAAHSPSPNVASNLSTPTTQAASSTIQLRSPLPPHHRANQNSLPKSRLRKPIELWESTSPQNSNPIDKLYSSSERASK